MKEILIFTIAVLGFSCSNKNPKEYITDKDIVINKRIFSDDSSRMILIYQYDTGALGYEPKNVAILNTKDSVLDLSEFNISNSDLYSHKVKWIGNDIIKIELDTLIMNDSFTNRHDTIFNGIKIKYVK